MSLLRVSNPNGNGDGVEITDILRFLEHKCRLSHLLDEFLLYKHTVFPGMACEERESEYGCRVSPGR